MINQSQKTTLNRVTFRIFLATFAITGFAVLIFLLMFLDASRESQREHINQHTGAVAGQISETVSYLYSIADHLAGSQEVKDLLELGSIDETESWSVRTRKLFPGTVGMVLVDPIGNVIGSKSNQRVGRLCARDINIFVRDGKVLQPPVHQDNPDLKHFDIFRAVTNEENEMVGMLMISFHVGLVSETLQRHAEAGYGYQLYIGNDLFVEYGSKDPAYTASEKIPGTDWALTVSASDHLPRESINWIIISLVLLAMVLGALVYGIKVYLRRALSSDIS